MNDRHDGSTRGEDAPTSVESSLAAIIDRYGPGLLYEPDRLRLLLTQDFPANDRQIAQLMAALAAGVPQRLLAAHGDEGLSVLLPKIADRLAADPAFDRPAARRAVDAWASALALPTSGPAPRAAFPTPSARPAADFASVVTPLSRRVPPPAPVPTPIDAHRARDPAVDDATLAGVAKVRDEPQETTVPEPVPAATAIDPTASMAEVAAPGEPPVVAKEAPAPPPTAPSLALPVAAAPSSAFPNWVRVSPPGAIAEDVGTPRPVGAPLSGEAPERRVPPTAVPAWARPSPADSEGAPESEPEADPAVTGADRPRRLRPIGMALAAFALVAIGVFLYAAYRPSRFESTGGAIEPSSTAPAANQPTAERIATSTALPTNDRAPAVMAAAPAVATPTRSSPVGGPSPGPVEAASPTPPAASPVAPPAPARAPSVTRIELPPIVAGQPFTIGVTASTGADDLATIERRTVDAAGRVGPSATVTPVATLQRDRSGGLMLPFQAIDTPSQTTVEITVVDRAGGRSAPRRVDLRATVAPAAPTVASKAPPPAPPKPKPAPAPVAKVEVARAPPAPKAAVPAASANAPAACTRATCGSVVSVRPVDAGWSTFEVIVRLDDRTIHTTRQTARWRVGSRVRFVGGRLQQLS